jgi:hypothetical protein
LGLRVWGRGFRVWGLGFGVWGLGFRIEGFGVRVQGSSFRVRVDGLGVGLRVSALSNGGPAPSLGEEVGLRLLRVILAPEAQPAHQVYHLCSEKGSFLRLIDSCIRNPVSWSGGQEHSLESY